MATVLLDVEVDGHRGAAVGGCFWLRSLTDFHSVGAAGVLRAGGTVINGVPRVTAGLVTCQLEQRPVVLIEVQLIFLATHEEVLTLGHEAGQGLGIESPELGIGALLAADATQEAV